MSLTKRILLVIISLQVKSQLNPIFIRLGLVKKQVFPLIGEDVMPKAHMGITKVITSFDIQISIFIQKMWKMNETATAFFTKTVLTHHYFKIGTQFMCTSQIYNHIPGNGILTRKDLNVGMVK